MKHIIIAMMLCTAIVQAHAQRLAVGTDILMDALMTPSIGAEMTTGERSTLGMNITGAYNPWGTKLQVLAIQPEYRYYISGRAMYGLFAGVGAMASAFDLEHKGKTYKGANYGGGLTFGYVKRIAQRWNIDFHGSLAIIGFARKEYRKDDGTDEGPHPTNSHGYYLMPSRLGISIAYIIR